MAFEGYLIKIGANDKFFNSFIEAESFKVSKKVIDVDSYRDANGVLHRNALEHASYTIEFNTRPLTNEKFEDFYSKIRSCFNEDAPRERKVTVKFWVQEDNDYVTADCYMPDIDFPINHIENNVILYDEITIKFIGY